MIFCAAEESFQKSGFSTSFSSSVIFFSLPAKSKTLQKLED